MTLLRCRSCNIPAGVRDQVSPEAVAYTCSRCLMGSPASPVTPGTPDTGGFAALEPGGLRCLRCGYTPLFRCVLPRDHWLSGRDWRNRQRQHALDRTLMNSGRASDFLFDMLEALEGNRKTVSAATA